MSVIKVVVFGKGEAGKTTLIQKLIPGAMNIEKDGRTIAMDYGTLTYEGSKFHFWGTPGQARFGPVREVLATGVDIAVFVNDTSRYFDAEDRNILAEMDRMGIRYVLFINHKPEGKKERRSTERLLEGLPQPYRIVEGSATSDEAVGSLLEALRQATESP
jgi:small GTP-binding protein